MVEYRATTAGHFGPVDRDLPVIDLSDEHLDAYWEEEVGDDTHSFILYRGYTGIDQVDIEPLYQRTRRFYRQRNQ